MGRSIAEALREEGKVEGKAEGKAEGQAEERLASRRETLLRQLRVRFGEVPAELAQVIQQTEDPAQLDHWLDRVVLAKKLGEIGIPGSL